MAELVRWGMLGAGVISQSLGWEIRLAKGTVLQVVAARGAERAAQLGAVRSTSSYESVLTDPLVDVVYVGLDTGRHVPWVEAALRAGKHVLCEKPLTTSAAETSRLFDVAAELGVLLVEAMWWRWHPRTVRAAELLAGGAIGPVRHVEAGFRFSGASGWRLEQPAGGALLDVGCYAVDAALWGLGAGTASLLPGVDVTAKLRTNKAGVDLAAEVLLDTDDGRTAQVRCAVDEPWAEWCVVRGETGEIALASPTFTAREWTPAVLEISDGAGTVRETWEPTPTYRLMVEAVSARVAGDTSAWLVTPAESIAVARVLDSARGTA